MGSHLGFISTEGEGARVYNNGGKGERKRRKKTKSKTVPAPYKVDLTLIPRLDSEHLTGQDGRPFRKAPDLRRSYGQIGDFEQPKKL